MRSITRFSAVVLLGLLCGSCEFDQGLGPLETRISGHITYLSPELRPRDVDEVRVVAMLNVPPVGLADVFFSEPIDFRRDTTLYDLFLPPGDYGAVAMLWRRKNEAWSFTSLLGVYGFEPPFQFDILPVSITDEQPVAEDVNMTGLWNFAASDASIRGRINFIGSQPDNTEIILLGAFNQRPILENILVSLIFVGGLPLPVSASRSSLNYQLKVFNNTYKFVGVFWKGYDTPFENMKLIGFYRDPDSPEDPGEFFLPENGSISGIDFTVDFNSLPEGLKPY